MSVLVLVLLILAVAGVLLAALTHRPRQETTMDALGAPATGPVCILHIPTNRVDNPDGVQLNRGTDHYPYPVVIDPSIDRRGEIQRMYAGSRIVLREWNEQVLLHEILHAALDHVVCSDADPHGHEVISRAEVALWEAGFRFRPVEQTNPIEAQR